MKNNNKQKKVIITGRRISRESIYYTALFTLALAVSIALLVIARKTGNKGLTIYSAILIPVFSICTLISTRFACISKNTIHVNKKTLVIKTFFITRRVNVAVIKKLTIAQNEKDGITSIKLTLRDKTLRYSFKNFTKDEATQLRHAISK